MATIASAVAAAEHRPSAEPVHHRGQRQRREAGDQHGVRVEHGRDGRARHLVHRRRHQVVGVGVVRLDVAFEPVGVRHPEQARVAGLGDVADARGVVDGVPVLRDGRQLADAAEHRGDPEAQRDQHGHGDARVRGAGPVGAGRRAFRRGPPAADEPPRAEADGADQDRDDGERRRRPPDAHRGAQRPGQPGDRVREQGRRGGQGPAPQACERAQQPAREQERDGVQDDHADRGRHVRGGDDAS